MDHLSIFLDFWVTLLTSPFDKAAGMSFEAWRSYFGFLLVIFMIYIIISTILQRVKIALRKMKPLQDIEHGEASQKGLKSSHKKSRRFVSYSFIFIAFYLAAAMMLFGYPKSLEENSEVISLNTISLNQKDHLPPFGAPRILEGEEKLISTISQNPSSVSEKISLSMGNVIKSLNIDVTAMVLSKDKRIAFATTDYYGTLKIIDISTLNNPAIIGSLPLRTTGPVFKIKSLLLSSDEKTLYVSNSRDLEIVDITELESPKLISYTRSTIFDDLVYLNIGRDFQTSLALDETTKAIFIGDLGLQIFDISNPKIPLVIKAERNEIAPDGKVRRNELCLSQRVLMMANGTLDGYDVSNPRDLKQIYSIPIESSVHSIYIEDSRKAYLLGSSTEDEIILTEVDLSDPKSPQVVGTSENTGIKTTNSTGFLAISPRRTKFFIYANQDKKYGLFIYDRIKKTTIKNEKSLVDNVYTMAFSQDEKRLITGSNDQFVVVELFLDYPNSQVFGSTGNILSWFELSSQFQKMRVSEDGKTLFILRVETQMNPYVSRSIFEIWDVENPNLPSLSASYKPQQEVSKMTFANNFNTVFLFDGKNLVILDVSTRSSPIEIQKYQSKTQNLRFSQLLTTSNGEIGFIATRDWLSGSVNISFCNFTKNGMESFFTINKEYAAANLQMVLQSDEKILFIVDKEIDIYDISSIESPRLIASVPLLAHEQPPYISSCLLSPDNKILYLETNDDNAFNSLFIYNVTEFTSVKLISQTPLPKFDTQRKRPAMSLSLDQKTGFVFQDNSLLMINLTNLNQPTISGIIPLSNNKSEIINEYSLSADRQRVYTVTEKKQVKILDFHIQYSLYLKQEKFLLGEKYSGNVAILGLTNKTFDYTVIDSSSLKIIKLTFQDIEINPSQWKLDMKNELLPSWINFDAQKNLLIVEPKKQTDLGKYNFQAAFSLKLPMNIFDGLGDSFTSEDVLTSLMSLGYVDNGLFLTANFDSFERFLLPGQFNTTIKREIYEVLRGYYFETCTGFEIVPSLELLEKENLNNTMPMTMMMINTPSSNHLKIEIKLQGSMKNKFLYKSYGSLLPVITEEKTKLSLEGSLKEINSVLGMIVVNFENTDGSCCTADIQITDGLNPTLSASLTNISRYFNPNNPPIMTNKTVQGQVNATTAWTGEYYIVTFHQDTFKDDYSENLSYDIAMEKEGKAVSIPNWLSLSGLTLRGTPPEEIFGRDLNLILIAKNEFKELKVPFKLHVNISSGFMLKLALRYSPYILTLVGLLVSANKIFNILGKRIYKHRKEYVLGLNEEIGPGEIFPIFFVKQERKERDLILKYLKKYEKRELLEDLIDTGNNQLEKSKIIQKIEGMIDQKISKEERKKLGFYCSEGNSQRKKLIQQLVIDKMTLLQLEKDKNIEKIFNKIKDDWVDLVYWDDLKSEFALDLTRLEELIEENTVNSNELDNTLQESLLEKSPAGVNIHLLKDALLAYCFEQHQINKTPVDIEIHLKQRIPSNPLWRFLKFDLKNIMTGNKSKIDHGINYKIVQGQLDFYGQAGKDLEGTTIVIQITTLKQRILKEIWVHGGGSRRCFENRKEGAEIQLEEEESYDVY